MGTSEAGKTTLCRHMRQLEGAPFEEGEVAHFKERIQAATLGYFTSMLSDLTRYDRNIVSLPTRTSYKQRCLSFLEEYHAQYVPLGNLMELALAIWHIPFVQRYISDVLTHQSVAETEEAGCTEHNSSRIPQYRLPKKIYSDHPACHFVRCFERIMTVEYKPTFEDILTLRLPTTGASENKLVQ